MNKKINFLPLTMTDLNLLCNWFQKPHILEWWNDHLTPEKIKEKYEKRINDPIVCPYIVYLEGKPIGFIQYYWANKVGNSWWPDEDDNTVGLDQFIGEENFLNQGYGTLMIKKFVEFLFQNLSINKIITEVDPKNLRAKRCYEKSGFINMGRVETPDGEAILMVLLKYY